MLSRICSGRWSEFHRSFSEDELRIDNLQDRNVTYPAWSQRARGSLNSRSRKHIPYS